MSDALDAEEISDSQEIALGHRAKAELDVTARAFAHLRGVMLEEIAASQPHQADRRERLYQGLQVLDAVKTALTRAVSAGEAAQMRQIVLETLDKGD